MLVELQGDQGRKEVMLLWLKEAAFEEEVTKRPVLGESPGVHHFDELGSGAEAGLHGKDAEEEIAIGGHGVILSEDLQLVLCDRTFGWPRLEAVPA